MYTGKVGERERKVNKPMELKINLAKKREKKKKLSSFNDCFSMLLNKLYKFMF